MSDEQVIREAVHSLKSGELSEKAFWIVAKNILEPARLTSEDMEWADRQIKRLTKTKHLAQPKPLERGGCDE